MNGQPTTMVTDPQVRAEAIQAGYDFYHQLPLGLGDRIMSAAANAYSVAFEGSQGRVLDHQRALQAAVAAAAPLLAAGQLIEHAEKPPTVPMERIEVGMLIQVPHGHRPWVRVDWIMPSDDGGFSRMSNLEIVSGRRVGQPLSIRLYQADYRVRVAG